MKNINIERIKRILKRGKMILFPIAISCTILTTGCSNTSKGNNRLEENAKKNGYSLSAVDDSLYDYFDKLYFINGSCDEDYSYDNRCTIEEFGKYTGDYNITWNDIRKTIDSNNNIDDNLKKIIYCGVDNLEKNNINCKLELLNYNLKNLKVEYVSYEDDITVQDGLFDAITQTVYINNNLSNDANSNKILLHEILGHGMTMGYINKDGGVLCSPGQMALVNDRNSNVEDSYIFELGATIKEAEAEMIAVLASGKKTDSTKNDHYCIFMQELQMILTTTDTSLNDLINNGTLYLLDRMKESGCVNPVDYIYNYDAKKYYFENNLNFCNGIGLIDDYQVDYLNQVIIELQNKGYSKEKIKNKINNSIYSSRKYIILDNLEGVDCISWTNNCIAEYVNYNYIKENTIGLLENNKSLIK